MSLKSYKELTVWQKSILSVKEIYLSTNQLPKIEDYCLKSQMRRAAISIPSNIAEGYQRQGLGKYLRFLNISESSALELETQIIISKMIYSNIDYSKVDSLLKEIKSMLYVMIRNLKLKQT